MKNRYANYTSQAVATLCRCLFLLLLVGLGACQRSAYSFQRVAEPEHPSVVVAPDMSSALVVAPAQQSALEVSAVAQPRHQTKRRVRLAPAPVRKVWSLLILRSATQAVRAQVAAQPQQDPLPTPIPVRHRSRALTLLLALLSITYLPFSLHNFYLGYYSRGAIAIMLLLAGIYLLFIGSAGLLFAEPSLAPFGYAGMLMLAAWFSWQIADIVRIITGNLKPKNGEYNLRFF